jgi:pyruvate dehydrogenase (quinone)
VHSLRGKEYIEYDNPFDVGMTGLIGFASGYSAMKSCDMLLMLGTDFPYRQFYPEKVTIAQVDTRAEALGNRCPIELGVLGTVKDTLDELLPMIQEKADRRYVTRLVSELADEDAIFSCDVGTPVAWTARYLKMNGKRRLVGSFNHGSMANSLLHSIGAQAAFRDRQVISMSGDGGFTMMMGEFLTLIQTGLPVKVVVLNNGTLGFVEMEMKASGFVDTGCDLKNPNFAAMANAIGIKGVRVEHPAELEGALREAFAHPGPALVDVVSARQELVMPPATTADQTYHFGLFMLRAVMDGRGQQLIDLAKVNLFR